MPKRIPRTGIIGQQGVNLIERITLELGFLWYPSGQLEAGIDGLIEIRDSSTGEVTNCVIQVQSRATAQRFTAETDTSFEYLCDAADLDYWLRGNAPVILVVSRPHTHEAYWIPIKDYFRDPATRRTRRVHFDKRLNRFDLSSRSGLLAIAVPRDSGIYFTPPPAPETLYSNLLAVSSFAPYLSIARTAFRDHREIIFEFQRLGLNPPREWLLRNKRFMSFHDLSEPPWTRVCDQGTLERFDASEWSNTDDPDRLRDFVSLLNSCLRQKTWKLGLRYSRDRECFYFAPTRDLAPKSLQYQSLVRSTPRIVFRPYASKTVPGKISYYRHSAFQGQFRRIDRQWYLEITPTYYFTWDGMRPDRFYQDHLKGIKRLERNGSVLGQLVMWAWFLNQPGDMFNPPYPFLTFGQLVSFSLNASIDDSAWLGHEEDTERLVIESSLDDLSLFQYEN